MREVPFREESMVGDRMPCGSEENVLVTDIPLGFTDSASQVASAPHAGMHGGHACMCTCIHVKRVCVCVCVCVYVYSPSLSLSLSLCARALYHFFL